ncbi:MAG: hypothetical protein BWX59_02109 [Bacteroidetes bacterium ADurb.Bin028]|nr:MAG: hypothetical protein BWX59_02109 [Bacteroidetes bacterium ADurb.Bin028]
MLTKIKVIDTILKNLAISNLLHKSGNPKPIIFGIKSITFL